VKRRPARPALAPEAAALMREAFEPRYRRKLDDVELDGMVDQLRRFTAILSRWDAEDRARTAVSPGTSSTTVADPTPMHGAPK
jgi:hypothetical protein